MFVPYQNARVRLNRDVMGDDGFFPSGTFGVIVGWRKVDKPGSPLMVTPETMFVFTLADTSSDRIIGTSLVLHQDFDIVSYDENSGRVVEDRKP
jgi:hypothetical protein